jgi:hypothetical protein
MTILLEAHGWKGLARWSDGIWRVAVLGWVTVGLSRQSLLDRMQKLVAAMKILAENTPSPASSEPSDSVHLIPCQTGDQTNGPSQIQ